jgi:putative colanic acid biosynthesis acetyltransferase WcaF
MILQKNSLTAPVFSLQNKLLRLLWRLLYLLLFRFSPVFCFRWRVLLLRLFGAKVDMTSRIYPSVNIWLPANLQIGPRSTLGPYVNVYNQGSISIATEVIVSQGCHLCASTHDYNDPLHPLLLKPIVIEKHAWICADVFIGPGVTVKQGAVVGARAALFKDALPWTVYSGNPAQVIKMRTQFSDNGVSD